jgi:uncharacterized protein
MELFFFISIIVIAFFYSSAGHGGATGYLAVMAILGFAPEIMKPTALILNLIVSSVAFGIFYKAGYFRFKLLWPFAITSVPMAFLGSQLVIDTHIYKIILGILLLFAVGRIIYKPAEVTETKPIIYAIALPIGALLGFFSGMIGIGGGIILSPILLLMGWTNLKQTAAISTVFIFLNSAAGLLGSMNKIITLPTDIYLWLFAGLIGGLAGSYYGGYKFPLAYLKYILSGVLLFASIKLFMF